MTSRASYSNHREIALTHLLLRLLHIQTKVAKKMATYPRLMNFVNFDRSFLQVNNGKAVIIIIQ